ncbi:HEAT repeat domain-containing protein [Zavarzinella formosa]|uniref:HEAT repeat domain-containing protein n=1 Tax=Zavarzinella formosa TaxID=360055 RepID=UPI0003716743|nr:HEAT repeat domain-containing protein [Zavarzinella formosa]
MFPRVLLSVAALSCGLQPVFAQANPKDKDRLTVAIEKGRAHLQKLYDPRGRGPQRNEMEDLMAFAGFHGNGQASLSGMAMLESGVPANDPSVTAIANGLRRNALGITNTYEVSLIIMFLDRLDVKTDEPLIQFMTLRLLSGQCADGSWSYDCGGLMLDPVEMRQLGSVLVKETKLVSVPGKDAPKPPVKAPRDDIGFDPKIPNPKDGKPVPKTPKPAEPTDGLHPALRRYAKLVNEGRGNQQPGGLNNIMGRPASGDHSNTQFATVGMWCGRRHGVDTANAFKLLEKHYRECQAADGGWSYTGAFGGSTPAMTCAGLMGLAMGFGSKTAKLATPGGGGAGDKPGADPANDKIMEAGLKCLGNYLSAAAAQPGDMPGGRGRRRFQMNELSQNYYFMWALERVGMIYSLQTIGKVDWYEWGSEILADAQQADGSWTGGNYHGATPELDTAFALLFLNRANLAQDLSSSLKGKVRDPGTSRLVGGGDLAKLLGPGANSGSSGTTKKPNPSPATPPENPKNESKTPTPPMPPTANEFEGKVRTLVRALVDADATEQGKLLETYRDAKGGEYTEALAQIATRLSGDPQAKTRTALASRLTRMKATTLNELLRDRDQELRRAAAVACGAKGDKTHSPELIRLLADTDIGVIQAARGGLKQLSGQDFGPEVNAGPADKSRAVLAWRKWWDSQK